MKERKAELEHQLEATFMKLHGFEGFAEKQ